MHRQWSNMTEALWAEQVNTYPEYIPVAMKTNCCPDLDGRNWNIINLQSDSWLFPLENGVILVAQFWYLQIRQLATAVAWLVLVRGCSYYCACTYSPHLFWDGILHTAPLSKHWINYGERVSDIPIMCIICPFPLEWMPFDEDSCILQIFSYSLFW